MLTGHTKPTRHSSRDESGFYGIVTSRFFLVALCVFLFIVLLRFSIPLEEWYEDYNYAHHPSGELAFAYGERHFQALNPAQYDLFRAQRYFYLAAQTDPHIPYLYHELARTSFLIGDFTKAMAQINIQIQNEGDATPNSFYVRGLIEGYMGDFDSSIADYKHFLQFDSSDWAAINDYSWVLLKAGRPQDAVDATAHGLAVYPNNPWLLNTSAIALYQTGNVALARERVDQASQLLQHITKEDWLMSYPGNDPAVAQAGINSFKKAVATNMAIITAATSTLTLTQQE